MKSVIVSLVFLLFSFSLYAQTWNEWFRQKKTQIKYLTQQIAGLQVYADDLSKGYKIARNGLHSIGDIKNGELNLHQGYISSLSKINPSIQHDFRIAEIVSFQTGINGRYHDCLGKANQSRQVSEDEVKYIHSVFDELLNNCGQEITDLTSLLTDNQLQLSDDERLRRIDAIYESMKDKYGFAQSFTSQTSKLMLNRQKAQNEIRETKQLYNLK